MTPKDRHATVAWDPSREGKYTINSYSQGFKVRVMTRLIKATLSLFLVAVLACSSIITVVGFFEFRAIRGKISQVNSVPWSSKPFADKYERNGFDRIPRVSITPFHCLSL